VSACPRDTVCDLSSTVPVGQGTQVCDCGESQGVRWARMELTEGVVERITGEPAVAGDKCQPVSVGWTWGLSPSHTQAIAMTMNPGGVQPVTLSSNSAEFLGSNGKSRNQPCGTVFPDSFQGTPVYNEGETPVIFPGSVPVSDYCYYGGPANSGHTEPDLEDGVEWQDGWSTVMQAGLGAVDAVCRCSLGRVGAMLELSGVFFTNPAFATSIVSGTGIETNTTGRSALVQAAYGWTETPQYVSPLVFYCREDYTLYWNLVFAYTAIYDTDAFTHSIWTADNTFAVAPQDRAYWIRYTLLGVDCLRNVTTGETDDNNACGAKGGETIALLPNVVVGLDIGQLFWLLDIGVWCGAANESVIPQSCAKDYLWAFASQRRRGNDACVAGGEGVPRMCHHTTALDPTGQTLASVTYAPYYNRSIPSLTTSPARMWPIYAKPSDDMFEFALETTALFVRIAAYSDKAGWTPDVFNTSAAWDIPAVRGAECDASMVAGKARSGPAADHQNITASCTSGASMNKINCPGSYAVRGNITSVNPTGHITGYCCAGGGPLKQYTCQDGKHGPNMCGNCAKTNVGLPEGSSGWKNCANEESKDICTKDNNIGNTLLCGNHVVYNELQAITCFHGPGNDADNSGTNPQCALTYETCGTKPSEPTSTIVNWAGGVYTPVFRHPRMRGMMPRVFYVDDTCLCSTADTERTAACLASIQYSACVMYLPRPAAAGIFARGLSAQRLDYRAVFFDPMLETLFGEAADARFVTDPAAGQFDGASAMYGNASHPGGYGGPLTADNFCADRKSDFCSGHEKGSQFSTNMLTEAEMILYNSTFDTPGSFAGILARYYSVLLTRGSPDAWYDEYYYGSPATWTAWVAPVTYSGFFVVTP
jgi:hypothetical protein